MEYAVESWNGFEYRTFTLAGRAAGVVLPETVTKNQKWLLKTEYFGAFPAFEVEMLRRGYALAHIQNETRWHRPADDETKLALCDFLAREYGFAQKCLPVGMSCGGMHAVYFAARYPERTAALYLDAPVLNLLSCPCGVGHATNEMYLEFCRDTGLDVSALINYRHHPIDCVPTLIEHRIPVFLVCGDSDNIVPYAENGRQLAALYEQSGVGFEQVLKPGCGHHPHGLGDNAPLITFAERYYGR